MIPLDHAAAIPEAGSKARVLARARAAGLAVPDGFLVLPGEPLDGAGILAELQRLGGARFVVRSSAALEDRAGASAAGVFESVVSDAAGVPAAIERVRASAEAAPARAYLSARGLGQRPVAMAALVQPLVDARALGVLHTSDAGALAAEERAPGEPEWGRVSARQVARGEPLAKGALALAALIGVPADVEYALTDDGPVFLQARPLGEAPATEAALDWDPGDDGRWVRDAAHNPDPLSAAQASLVAWIEGVPGLAPQRLVRGYLYYRADALTTPARIVPAPSLPAVFAEIEAECSHLLSPHEGEAPDPERLGDALEAYRAVAARYFGELQPSLRRVRDQLDQLLRANLGEPLEQHGALLAGIGGATVERDTALWRIGRAQDPAERPRLIEDYAHRFGAWAPAWDVAVPCDDELPTRVLRMAMLVARGPDPSAHHAEASAEAAATARELYDRMDRMARGALKHLLPVARAALALAESDDALFFRAQRAVRRALLGLGDRLYRAGELADPTLVFDVPAIDLTAGELDQERALSNRAARLAAAEVSPPSEILARKPIRRAGAGGILRGAGTRGRAGGRAFVLRDPSDPPSLLPPDAVLVTAALLPSLSYLLSGARALVTDHGGALSHGATLAREYGVPAVLGTGHATARIADGDELLVDADAGRVYRMHGG